MTTRILGGISVDLDDGPIRTEYGCSLYDGRPTARLWLGNDVSIAVTTASPQTLHLLGEYVAELTAWAERQDAGEVA